MIRKSFRQRYRVFYFSYLNMLLHLHFDSLLTALYACLVHDLSHSVVYYECDFVFWCRYFSLSPYFFHSLFFFRCQFSLSFSLVNSQCNESWIIFETKQKKNQMKFKSCQLMEKIMYTEESRAINNWCTVLCRKK